MKELDKEEVEEHRLSLREMEKSEKEMFIIASLQKYTNDETRLGKMRRTRYRLMFNGRLVCKAVFLYVIDIGQKTLRNIIKHVTSNGAVPRIHGNKGRKPHNALRFGKVKFCVDFLLHHAQLFGLPMVAAPRGHDEAPPVYLSCSTTKRALDKAYSEACLTAPIRQLGLSSFKGVWRQCCPHIRIMTPKEDVCQLLKNRIADSDSDRDKLEGTKSLGTLVEIAIREKDVCKQDIRQALAEVSGMELTEGPVPPLSTELTNVHCTFDYAHNVAVPHHSQQMGPSADNVQAYLCWRVHRGLHEEIELKMQMPGHTKCLFDGRFGRIKNYRRRDCDSLSQLAETVDKSTCTNRHVSFKKPNGEHSWEWFDCKSYLSRSFLAVKGIQKFHTFRVTAAEKEAVFVCEASNTHETKIKILKAAQTDPFPAII